MTKVEIDGKTYCVETLIYTVERLTKDVKASAEYHKLVLEQIRDEIEAEPYISKMEVLDIIDKHISGDMRGDTE